MSGGVYLSVQQLPEFLYHGKLKIGEVRFTACAEVCIAFSEFVEVGEGCGQKQPVMHIEHGFSLNESFFVVAFEEHFVAGIKLLFGKDFVSAEQLDILFLYQYGNDRSCISKIRQSQSFGFFHPFFRIAVPVENDTAVIRQNIADYPDYLFIAVGGVFEAFADVFDGIAESGVEHDAGFCNGSGRAGHPELEFISREGERTGTVSVGVVEEQCRDGGEPHVEDGFFAGTFIGFADE